MTATTVQVELPKLLVERLQKIAEAKQTSVANLIADMADQLEDDFYVAEDEDENGVLKLSPEELAALQEAVDEGDAPGAKRYTMEEVQAQVQRFLYGDGKWDDDDDWDDKDDCELPTLVDRQKELYLLVRNR